MTDTTVKKTKHRQMTFDSLKVHSSKLPLGEKVELVKELKEQIEAEIKRLQEAANGAHSLASQLAGTAAR